MDAVLMEAAVDGFALDGDDPGRQAPRPRDRRTHKEIKVASVSIHRPGQSAVDEASGQFRWTFTATVDGNAGIVTFYTEGQKTEDEAAEDARTFLEQDPSLLEGIS